MALSRNRDVEAIFRAPDAPDATTTIRAVRALVEEPIFTALSRDLEHALRGDAEATRAYVADYRVLTETLLETARAAHPDVIAPDGHGRTAQGSHGSIELLSELLTGSSLDAPFSAWHDRFAPEDAVALHLTGRLRGVLGLLPLIEPAGVPAVADDMAAGRFLRRVRHYLNHPGTEHPLRRVMDAFALSKTETGRLFGVSRQGIDGWLADGVPPDRQEKLTALLALVDLLERKLKPDRLPGIARRPADAYGGHTMLELIGADRHDELLEQVRASFDWSIAA